MRFPCSLRAASPSDETRRRYRWRRRGLSALAWAGALVALLATVVLVLLQSLDQPRLKRRIQALVRASAGVDIDYRTARVDLLSGLENRRAGRAFSWRIPRMGTRSRSHRDVASALVAPLAPTRSRTGRPASNRVGPDSDRRRRPKWEDVVRRAALVLRAQPDGPALAPGLEVPRGSAASGRD